MSYAESKRYQNALEQYCAEQFPHYLMTLHFHSPHALYIRSAQKTIRHWAAMVDRKLLGKRWLMAESRMRYIAVPEGHRSHESDSANPAFRDLHYHLILTPAEGWKASVQEEDLRVLFSRLWTKCAPAGEVDLQSILDGACSRRRVSSYVCKRVSAPDAIGLEYFVLA